MKAIELLKGALFGRMGPHFFKENEAELQNTNYGLLRTACLFSSGMCLFLFCLTLMNPLIGELSRFYFFYTLFFAALTAFVLTLVNRRRKLVALFFYIFASAIFILVIDVGTRRTPALPAVTFYVFLLIIPILFVTKPINAVYLSLAACAVFCTVTALVKGADAYLVQTDILNAVCCCIVGLGFDITIVNLHLENIQGKAYFKRQSTIDELTGLPNRRSFDTYIETLYAKGPAQVQGAALMILNRTTTPTGMCRGTSAFAASAMRSRGRRAHTARSSRALAARSLWPWPCRTAKKSLQKWPRVLWNACPSSRCRTKTRRAGASRSALATPPSPRAPQKAHGSCLAVPTQRCTKQRPRAKTAPAHGVLLTETNKKARCVEYWARAHRQRPHREARVGQGRIRKGAALRVLQRLGQLRPRLKAPLAFEGASFRFSWRFF